MRIAVVGATGLVGSKILEVLRERRFPVSELIPVATERSAGKKLEFNGKEYTVITPAEAVEMKPEIALFSAGGNTSLEWAGKFASKGTYVVDNSSAWRMEKGIPLIVPEINSGILTREDRIIANPNCSTIQFVVAVAPLHNHFGLKKAIISTYQSVTGSGVKAVRQLENERAGISGEKAYPHEIDMNCIPQCDVFLENGFTKEEMKLVLETKKILDLQTIEVTATAVRVPVSGGHSESVYLEFCREIDLSTVYSLLSGRKELIVLDNNAESIYPMPKFAKDRDEVFVGRIRKDLNKPNALNMWIVADNLRKGAATNAVQIAEYINDKFLKFTV